MSDFIGIDVSGEDVLAKKIEKLPEAAQDMVTDTVSQFLIKNILSIAAPKNYVTRKAAYGQTFQSDRQRKWFFAALESGEINVPYHRRSPGMTRSWKQEGSGARSFLSNSTPGAEFVIGDKQSRHEKMVGWLKVSETLKQHNKAIMDKADEAIKKAIRKVGL